MRCGICKFQNKSKLELPCLECTSNRAMDYFKTMTNADRIRNMTDEELAEYLYGVSEGTADCVICDDDCDYCELEEECKNRMLQWLQAEVKEGAE